MGDEETGPDEDLLELLERTRNNVRWYATKKCKKGDQDACGTAFSEAEQSKEWGEDEDEEEQEAGEGHSVEEKTESS